LYYDATQGVVQVYDRGGSTFKPLILNASQITLIANSHNMVLDSGGTLTTPIGITVNSARGANQGGLNLHAAAAGNDVGVFAENGNLYCWFNNTGGQLLLQGPSGAGWVGATLGSVSVQGQLSTTGNLLAGGAMYVGSAGDTYLTRNGANSLSTSGALLVSGALVVSGAATFQSTLSVSGSLSIANLAVTSYLTAGGGTMPNSGAIRLTANSQIMWSGGSDYGVWIDSSGYFNLKQGQVIAGGASGGSVGTPSTCRGFLQVNISGTGTCKIPIYNN